MVGKTIAINRAPSHDTRRMPVKSSGDHMFSFRISVSGMVVMTLLMIPGARAGEKAATTNLLTLCDQSFELGDYVASASYSQKIMLENPADPAGAWRLSRALIITSNLEKKKKVRMALLEQAMSYAELAVSGNPESSQGHTCLAICRANLADLVGGQRKIELGEGARASAERAVELEPGNFLAYLILGAWHREMATLGGFTRVVAKIVYGGLPRGASLDESEKCLRRAVQLAPDRINPHLQLGLTLLAMKQYHKAEKAFEKATVLLVKSPDDAAYQEDARKQLVKVRKKLK
jgi:tetratricopeptide (TPR) repeat protein